MNRDFVVQGLRNNWYLLILAVLFLGGGAFMAMRPKQVPAAPAGAGGLSAIQRPAGRGESGAKILNQHAASPRDEARATIEGHRAKIEENPESEEAPALLAAMGNLYRQKLLDYGEAAQCYERLIMQYPEWEGVRSAYIQMATCYERLNDRDNALRVYRAMMDAFPEDSQEYQYARKMTFEGVIAPTE